MLWRHLSGAVVLCTCLGCATSGRDSDSSPWGRVVRPPGDPIVRITFLARDSVALELADSGYAVIVAHSPGTQPRILYPAYDAQWELSPKGRTTLGIFLDLLESETDVIRPESQCIVQSQVVSVWSPADDEQRRPVNDACGPVPVRTSSARPGRVVRPTYEFGSPLQSYVFAVFVHHSVVPRSIGSWSAWPYEAPPVQLAREMAQELVWPRDSRWYWQAAVWIAR